MQALPDVYAPGTTLSTKWNIATEGLSAAQRQTILDRMKVVSFDPKAIRRHAEKFSRARFGDEMEAILKEPRGW